MIHYSMTDRITVLRLDAPPLNTLSFELVGALVEAIGRVDDDPSVTAVVLIGSPTHFSAGVDLGIFEQLRTAEDARNVSRRFQEAFQRIEDCGKPVVAALAGRVMGGALELAMACHARVAAAGSTFSTPEVKLGINPGAGGTQRLPRLVGPELALRMLVGGEPIKAEEALAAGLIDATCDAEELAERAMALAGSLTSLRRTMERTEKIQVGTSVWHEAERAAARSRPEILAPKKIVEAVRAGIERSPADGLRCEQESFAACIGSQAARSKIHLFFATRRAAKTPEFDDLAPPKLVEAAVVGMGTMGSGITQALLAAGLKVVVYDEDRAALARGEARVRQAITRRVEHGRLSRERAEESLERLTVSSEWLELAGADLAIEAVFEDAELKQSVFARLEEVCRAETILASNTSTISLDELARGMKHPERLVGLHFFNPAQRMPLLEVIRPAAAAAATVAGAMHVARRLGKTPVLVKNRAGFIVSRLFVPYLKEAFWLVEEGAEPEAVDRAMIEFGFPMGPLALIDMAGIDILARTDRVLRGEFAWHGEASCLVERLVNGGHLGQKTGMGVYRYEAADHAPHPSAETERLLAEIRRERGLAVRVIGGEEITSRLVLRMVNEAFYILRDGIARQASDLDVAVVLGIGFPDFRGGVVRYAEDRGRAETAAELGRLAERFGERFAPCSELFT